jgi:hypothetical protein
MKLHKCANLSNCCQPEDAGLPELLHRLAVLACGEVEHKTVYVKWVWCDGHGFCPETVISPNCLRCGEGCVHNGVA